jgi:demethylmenaquinone methyltransferase/2-methoxy-6-polyprenyl-1,4-benzoquinol methylase
MFDDIHARYDRLNSILSFGQDRRWRKTAVREIPSGGAVIDLCSGGGELALELFSRGEFNGDIILADISFQMMSLYKKILGVKYPGRYFPVLCDVEYLPFKDNVFDGAMSAFSLRNLNDLRQFSSEANRTVKPGGVARYLEIAHPENRFLRTLFELYFYRISPLAARLFTNKVYAYKYLPASLKAFPGQQNVIQILCEGWGHCEYKNILGGIAAVYKLSKS